MIVLMPVAFWMPSLVAGPPMDPVTPGTIPGRLIESFNQRSGFWSALLALLLVMINGYLLVQLNTVHIFIPGRTPLPAFFYYTLVIGFSHIHQLTTALLASTLIIYLLYRIFASYKYDGESINFLDAGLLVSAAGLLFLPAMLFFPLLLTGLIILRPFNWREWTYAVIGMALPFGFLAATCYLVDFPLKDYFTGFSDLFKSGGQHYNTSQLVSIGGILAIVGYASYYMVTTISNMKIQARKMFMVFLWLFLYTLLIYFTVRGTWIEVVYFLAIPLSFLLSHYFTRCRKNWINDLIFSVFLLLLILQLVF